jgi:hypothetical protein
MTSPSAPLHTEAIQPIRRSSAIHIAPDAYRVVDWSQYDASPAAGEVDRLLKNVARDGAARLAVLVSTPKALLAANVFAEQAGLLGARVRVFVGAAEAVAWLYRDLPAETFTHEWPVHDDVSLARVSAES